MKTIAVDLDDVLAANAEGFVNYSNQKWGTSLVSADYTEHWAELWGVDEQDLSLRANHFYGSGTVKNFKYIDQAQGVLRRLSEAYRLVILTSRHRAMEQDTLEWLSLHYEGIFSEVKFAGIWDAGHKSTDALMITKANIAKQIGADFLIDDQPKHCIAATQEGITSILFGDYAWNASIKLCDGMIRAHNWPQVEEYFDGLRS